MKTKKDRLFVLFLLLVSVSIFLLLIYDFFNLMIIISIFGLFYAILFLLIFFFYPQTAKCNEKPKKYPNVAVVTYAFNNWEPIEKTVKELLKLKYPKPFKVYVITDGTCSFLEKYPVELVKIDKKNFKNKLNVKATIMNIGLKKINAEYFFCVDGDTIPKKDAIIKMIPFLNDKDVVVVNGFLVPSNTNKLITKIQAIEYNFSWGLFQRITGALNSIFVAVGGMCLIQKKAFEEVGGYDETNVTEDREIIYRFRKKGYKIKFAEDSRGYTEVPETLGKLKKQRDRWFYGEIDTATKHRSFYFNKNFKTFGLFALPYSLFLQLLSISILFKIAHFAYNRYILFYYYFITEMIKQSYFVGISFTFPSFLPSATFFWIIVFMVTIFFMFVGFTLSDFKLDHTYFLAFFIFIFIYNIYLGVIYINALIQNLIGDFKWEKS